VSGIDAVVTDQQRTDLYKTLTAYGVTYTFDRHKAEHKIDIFWNKLWPGATVAPRRDLRQRPAATAK
jgi:hypothetical protein